MNKEDIALSSQALLEQVNEVGGRGMNALADRLNAAGELIESRASDLAEQMQWNITREQLGVVTDRLDRAATYLRTKDPIGAAEDVDRYVHAHPWRAVAIGFGVGYLLSKIL